MTTPHNATLVTLDQAPKLLRIPGATDDKYSRGVVGFVTGSLDYPGAALLGVGAALHTGVGMVRYLGPQQVAAMVLMAHPEVVIGPGRVTAAVIGSGLPDTSADDLTQRLAGLSLEGVPVVVDAAALIHRALFSGPAILTPHSGELARMAEEYGAPEGEHTDQAVWLAGHLEATVVLKGHKTFIASPGGRRSILPDAPTWLATAGTGDVLAGIMGAVLTSVQAAHQGTRLSDDQCHDVAVVGCLIHQDAGRRAATLPGGGEAPYGASDVAARVREAVGGFITR